LLHSGGARYTVAALLAQVRMYPDTHDVVPLPAGPRLEHCKQRANDLAEACHRGTAAAIHAWAAQWPDHVDRIAKFADQALRSRDCALTAAQPVIARIHGFGSRAVFAIHLEALASSGSPISNFETAVDAKSPRADARMVAALRTGVA
jgi:hypothetical protein